MMKTQAIVMLLVLAGCAGTSSRFGNLPAALDEAYPIWKVNGSLINTNGVFEIHFSDAHPDEIAIRDWKTILNGTSHQLLACHGIVLNGGNAGFIVGTAIEGPTFGKLLVYDEKLQRVGSSDCQKVVSMRLADLLADGQQEIVTLEDHHYGTYTTRRVLNVYKVSAEASLERIFEHDVVDARRHGWNISEGQPEPITKNIHYTIDLDSRRADRKIVVTDEDGDTKTFGWNGTRYAKESLSTRNSPLSTEGAPSVDK